jgi:hypothetical protein
VDVTDTPQRLEGVSEVHMEQAEEERDGERREETGRRKEAILPARLPGG